MRSFLIIAAGCLAFALGGCEKKSVEQAAPAAGGQADAATQVGVSTSSGLGSTLNAPGNYMRGLAGNIGKAEKAASVYSKAAEEHRDPDPEAGN